MKLVKLLIDQRKAILSQVLESARSMQNQVVLGSLPIAENTTARKSGKTLGKTREQNCLRVLPGSFCRLPPTGTAPI